MNHARSPSLEPVRPPEHDPGALVDWAQLRARIGFALRAVRRRPLVATCCFVAIAALGPVSLAVAPKTWRVEAVVTAEHDPVVSTVADPVLLRPFGGDDAANAARDAILRRDNLLALVDETGLIDRALAGRSPLARVRDLALELAEGHAKTREDRRRDLVEALEKKLTVKVPGAEPGAPAGAPRDRILLALEWSDGEAARRVLDAAVRRFFEERRAREEATGRDVVAVLDERAAAVRDEIEAKVGKIHGLELAMLRGNPSLARSFRAPQGRVPQEQELMRLRISLESRKAALADLERLRQARAEELRAQLTRERVAYGEQHPALARTREVLAGVEAPSPQASAMRAEIAGLEQEFSRASERAARLVDDEDPSLEYERTELRILLARATTLRDRVDAARVESAVARAGFDRRYAFAVPPVVPRRPERPIPALSIAAGLLGGALLALLVAAVLDLRSGVVLERSQLEERMGLRVLGELRAP
jgi:hypothetical protein